MELRWTIEKIRNGFLVDGEMFFKTLDKAIECLKDNVDRDCENEFEDGQE